MLVPQVRKGAKITSCRICGMNIIFQSICGRRHFWLKGYSHSRRELRTTRRATKGQVLHQRWDMIEQENMAQVIAEVQVTSDDEDVTLVVRKIQNQSLMERKSQRNIQQVAEEK